MSTSSLAFNQTRMGERERRTGHQKTRQLTPLLFTVSVFSILRNPMILLGLVSMGIFFGMPYLVDNSEYISRLETDSRPPKSHLARH